MPKTTNILIAAGMVVLLLFFTAFFFADGWLENKIRAVIAEKVTEPHRLSYDTLTVSFLNRSLVLKGISANIIFEKEGRQTTMTIPEIQLTGIDWFTLAFAKKLNIRSLQIDRPVFSVSQFENKDPVSQNKTSGEDGLKAVRISETIIRHGQFQVSDSTKNGLMYMAADSFDLDLSHIFYEKTKDKQPVSVEQMALSVHNFSQKNEAGFHEISCRKLHLSSRDSLVEITGFSVKPRYTTQAFFANLKYKKSKLSLEFPAVHVSGWHFQSALQGHIAARKIFVDQMKIAVLSDKLLAVDPTAYKPLPQELLLNAPFKLSIDSLEIKNSWLQYENLGMDRSRPGRLEFSNLQGQLINITNDTSRIRQKPLLEIAVTANLQRKHFVTQQLWMDLSDPDYAFTYSGSSSDVLFTDLNDFLSPTNRIAFEKGTIKSIDYRINADKNVAIGELELEYTDLDFSFLDENQQKKKVLSEIVDLFFIDKNNLKSERDFQKGKVHAERNTHQSFFNFWWEGIQSGIRSSVLTDKNMERIQKRLSRKK